MPSYLITGASRGIGLELVKQLLRHGSTHDVRVFALTRSEPSMALQELVHEHHRRCISIVAKDFTNQDFLSAAVEQVGNACGNTGLDVLVNVAGATTFNTEGVHTMTPGQLSSMIDDNVLGTHMVTSAFLPLLHLGTGKKMINISTSLGSMAEARRWMAAPTPAYKISKAALNMLTVQYALQFADQGFTFVAVSPGWVKSELGSQQAHLELAEAAAAILEVVAKVDRSSNGRFLNIRVSGWENKVGIERYDGAEIPW